MTVYQAFIVANDSREQLLQLFPTKFPKVIAHHVTYALGTPTEKNPPQPTLFEVVGYTSDVGIEALIVKVDGSLVRPDGGTYHITWSLDPALGRRPKDSNTVIKQHGYHAAGPIQFNAEYQVVNQ